MDAKIKNQLLRSSTRFTYDGIECLKNPLDLGILMVLLKREQPKTIIEVGSHKGGSARLMHDLTVNFGLETLIYSVDIRKPSLEIPNVLFLQGNGRDLEYVFGNTFMENCKRPLLIIEDSDHTEETSYSALKFFAKWSKPNEMIVIEDGVIGPPLTAIKRFLSDDARFEIDLTYCDLWGIDYTLYPDGYIRRLPE